jgi:integrase
MGHTFDPTCNGPSNLTGILVRPCQSLLPNSKFIIRPPKLGIKEASMRVNKFGIRGLKCVRLNGKSVYCWTPPISLQKAGVFKYKYLGADFVAAVAKAKDWNTKLDAYRVRRNGIRPVLANVIEGTVGHLVRQFEASPRFARYSARTQQDYSWMYRAIECQPVQGVQMFGEMKISKVTRQIAYSVYEENVKIRGHDSANKAMCAWSSAFRYATFKFPEITLNPFSELDKLSSPPRRQRWTDRQLSEFVEKADDLGYPSIGRCALMCMELMQRPGDILDLRWGSYQEYEKVWHIRQSKRGAIVRIPETRRLRLALNPIRLTLKRQKRLHPCQVSQMLVCGTVTGKRWYRRNFTKVVRHIAGAAGLPDDLQIRDLRRTAATEGASAGATPAEMMAVGGWANQASIRPYLVQTREQAAAFQTKRDKFRRRQSP